MARITVLVCDAPGCSVRAEIDPGPFVSRGYLIARVDFDGGRLRDVFACKIDHVAPAIRERFLIDQLEASR